jgi:hypothetical protein
MYNTVDPMVGLAYIALIIAGIIIMALFYMVPYIIAASRDMAQRRTVFWLNVLIGWSLIGWVALGLWAIFGETKQQLVMHYDSLTRCRRREPHF